VLLFPALVVLGAFGPQLPFVARFGAFVSEDLPWIGLGAVISIVLATIALRLGGRRPARVLLLLGLLTFGGTVVIAALMYGFAGQQGATFSITRQASTPEPAARPSDRRVFATIDGTDLSTDIYRASSGTPGSGPSGRAAVVYVHGGAFVGGGLGGRPHLFQFLADQGVVVLDVEYRLSPPPRWQDAPADVLCALVWLRGAAAELDVDPDRVFLMGESAGGSLALVAGYAARTPDFAIRPAEIAPSCEGFPIVPAGIIAIAPAADLAGIWEDGTLEADGRRFPEAYVGGSPSEYPDRYAAASPFDLLRPGLPPTLLIGAANDHLVLPIRVTSLADRLRAAGVDCRLVMVPFAEHGFDGYPNGYGQQLEESILPAFMRDVTD
jgi:acetyl esterase/lipase